MRKVGLINEVYAPGRDALVELMDREMGQKARLTFFGNSEGEWSLAGQSVSRSNKAVGFSSDGYKACYLAKRGGWAAPAASIFQIGNLQSSNPQKQAIKWDEIKVGAILSDEVRAALGGAENVGRWRAVKTSATEYMVMTTGFAKDENGGNHHGSLRDFQNDKKKRAALEAAMKPIAEAILGKEREKVKIPDGAEQNKKVRAAVAKVLGGNPTEEQINAALNSAIKILEIVKTGRVAAKLG